MPKHIAQSVKTRPISGFNYIKDIFKFQVVMFYNFNINSAAYGVRAIRCIFFLSLKGKMLRRAKRPDATNTKIHMFLSILQKIVDAIG